MGAHVCCSLPHQHPGPSHNYYPTARLLSRIQNDLPVCSSRLAPASQSEGRFPPADTQQLAAALFITTDPRLVSSHVKDPDSLSHTLDLLQGENAVGPTSQNKVGFFLLLLSAPMHAFSLFLPHCSHFTLIPLFLPASLCNPESDPPSACWDAETEATGQNGHQRSLNKDQWGSVMWLMWALGQNPTVSQKAHFPFSSAQ